MKNKETILITGAGGYLAHELITQLLARADELNIEKIIAYDNLMYKNDNLTLFARNPKFQFVLGDVTDYNTLQKYISQATIIAPLACITGAPACNLNKKLATEVNTNQINYIVNNCSWGTKIIYFNTNSIFGIAPNGECNEDSPKSIISHYAKTKQDSEDLILENGHISLRLSTVMGFSGRFRKDLLVNFCVLEAFQRGYIVLSEENVMRSYIHIFDVCSAWIHALKNFDTMKGQAYNVSAEDCSKRELCEKIKKYIPNFVIKADSLFEDVDKRNYRINFDKIKKTGWTPKYSVDNAIQELFRGYPILLNSQAFTQYTNL